MCTLDGGERADVFSWSFRVARKQHRCEACSGWIQPGTRYGVLFTVFDGCIDSTKACVPCYRVGEEFGAEHHHIPHPSALVETLQECIDWDDESASKWRPKLRTILERSANAKQVGA